MSFVPADLERTPVMSALAESSFDPARRAFLSLLGVVYYLSREVLVSTVRSISEGVAAGSQLMVDYMLDPDSAWPEHRKKRAGLKAFVARRGEPMRSDFSLAQMSALMGDAGFRTVEGVTMMELGERYAEELGSTPRSNEPMNTIPFPITRVNRLRRAAAKARRIPELDSDWSRKGCVFAHGPANDLLSVFETLRLKPGFVLHASAHRDSLGGNGRIWAVPADAVPVASGESPKVEDVRAERPPGAAVTLMQAIEGDETPWSYLSASILSREAAEFGAWWHRCDWSVQTILSKPPRHADDPDVLRDEWELTGDAPVGNWTWHGLAPHTWEPTFAETGKTTVVVMHVRNPVGQETIYRATDTYGPGSYDGTTETEVLCSGRGGIVF